MFSSDALCVSEASHSNVFAALKSGPGRFLLFTHPLDNVLSGITRNNILRRFLPATPFFTQACEGLGGGLEVQETPWTLHDLLAGRVAEIVITSTGVNSLP